MDENTQTPVINQNRKRGDQPKVRSIIFYSFSEDDALAVLRVREPARVAGLKVISGVENGVVRVEAVNEGDIVVIQRDFCRDYESYEQIITRSHSQNKPIVLDLDDLLFELPEDHPDRLNGYYADALLPLFQAVMEADLITVATARLRDYLLPYNQNIQVVPNYLDDSLWQLNAPADLKKNDENIIIGYMGGQSHQPDLAMVIPALLQVAEKYPGRIHFHFWGIEPPAELSGYVGLDWSPAASYRYADFAAYFQNQSADIMIAPLADNLFNTCKSAIKYFEYSAIGVAGVYSRIAPYSDIVSDGVEGLLASNRDEWVNSISSLVEDPGLRARLVQNAQQEIKQKWLLSKNAAKRLKIYDRVFSRKAGLIQTPPHFGGLIRSLSRQNYEENQRKDERIRSLGDLISERELSNKNLAHQIAEREHSIETMTGQIAECEQSIREMTAQQIERDRSIQLMAEQIAEGGHSIQAMTEKIAERGQMIREMTVQLAERDESNRALNAQIAEQNRTIQAMTAQIAEQNRTIQAMTVQIAERDRSIQAMALQIAERDRSIQVTAEQVADLKQTLQAETGQIADLEQTIQVKTGQIAERDQSIQKLTDQLEEREQEVVTYALSRSWRITRPIRKIMKIFRKKE